MHAGIVRPPVGLRLAVVVAAALTLSAWLLPTHSQPWLSFYNEVAMPLGLLPLAAWVLWRDPSALPVPRSALAVLTLAAVPLAQWGFGQIRFGGDAMLASLYLVGLAVCIVFGARWRAATREAATVGAALWVVAAAVLTLGLALVQWLRLDGVGVLLADLPRNARPAGNVGQANHFATLMAWGLIGVWLLYEGRRVRGAVAWLPAVCLLFGIALSQSRTGWLHVVLLTLAALVLHRRGIVRLPPRAALLLGTGFLVTVLAWTPINQALLLAPALTAGQLAQGGSRLLIWQQSVAAIAAAPWSGYGWTQVGLAQQAMLEHTPPVNVVFSYAHNLELDLMLWNGVPLALLTVSALGLWLWRRVRRIASADSALLLLVLLTLLIHAQFEFPYAYAYFLLPAGLVAGMLDADTGAPARLVVPRAVWGTSLVAVAVLLGAVTVEYVALERSLMRYRFEAAHVGRERGSRPPPTVLLTQLGALMHFVRTEPAAGLDDAQLEAMQRVVARFPSAGNQFRLALAWARNGKPDQAALPLRQLCAMQRAPACSDALAAWAAIRETDSALRPVVLPSAPVKR